MSEELELDEEAFQEALLEAKKKRLKMMIIAAAVAVLLLGGGGAAYYFFFSSSGDVVAPENDPDAEPEAKAYFYDLPEMTVNLNSKNRKAQYLRIKVSLEMLSEEQARKIEPFMPRVLDAFQVYLRELRSADLEGSAGLFRLKRELLKRINDAIYPVKVNDILFKEILIQ